MTALSPIYKIDTHDPVRCEMRLDDFTAVSCRAIKDENAIELSNGSDDISILLYSSKIPYADLVRAVELLNGIIKGGNDNASL